jgi:ACS family glucarate transporter-like MFS transporter
MSPKAKRYAVIASLFVLSLITYIDRAAISAAKGPMAAELSLSDSAVGLVFSAFALGYAAAQIPSGWFADRFGPRIALAIVVALWSVLTSLTGAMHSLGPLLAVRFLFGIAEAGAFPGSARVFYNWLPAGERGIANGILFSGALLGGAVAFPFCNWLLESFGWRHAFYYLGIPGFVWVACWLTWFRDYPRERVVHEAAASGPRVSFGQVFRSRVMMLNMFQYFAGNFTFFICISWFHPYLIANYGISNGQAARLAMIPLLCGAGANWVSGLFVDALYKAGHRAWSRRLPAIIGFVLAASGVFAVSFAGSSTAAVAAFAVALFGVEMTISPSWAFCLDIGGTNSGAVSASMNMVGNFGGFVSANAFPFLQRLSGSSAAYFQVAAALNVAALLCWFLMRARQDRAVRSSPALAGVQRPDGAS